MCSVSWLLEKKGYQVFFNRDEQKSRALALPPKKYTLDGVDVLMPLDPVGGGSWISMNQFGLSLCLLNNYQGKLAAGSLLSRGLLLKQLSSSSTTEQVSQQFQQLEIERFAPFTLLVFSPNLSLLNPKVMAYTWNGEQISIYETDSPLFSSGFDLSNVVHYRQTIYRKLTQTGKSQETLLAFHSHHHPDFSHMSTCMHREDAHTVSFTHLHSNNGDFSMFYRPGSPCSSLKETSQEQGASKTIKTYQIANHQVISHQITANEISQNRSTFDLSEALNT
ncbi:MAG: NRDE family protein [Vibrio gallaecicus]|uniref:NRDE family protein n=1 Tax=Vibrio kagoshimensis TaxID=2910244 RepID=UPI003C4BD102